MGPFGSNIKVECFVDEGIPVLNGSNLEGYELKEDSFRYVTQEKADSLKKANAYRGDIVITHRGTLGQIVFIPQTSKYERYVISQSQFRIKCNAKVLPEYMVYYFHTRLGQHKLLSNASQVGVPALARPSTTFQKIDIEIPDILSQKQIIAILQAIHDKITLNTAINENLEQQAQAIFKSWFVDFEPFGGVMPEDWKNGTVNDIVNIHDSKRKPLSGAERDKMEKNYPYYGATSLMDYVDNYLFDGIYLLLGEDGTVVDDKGFPILQYVYGQFWVNNHAHILTGKKGFSVELLYLFFKQTNVKSIVTGAVQQKISQANLKKIEAIIPTEDILNKFNQIIQPYFATIRNNRDENQRLSALRDTLLPKLMNGEIDVSNVQI
jgi:type I restriction enzyme S subunit